MPTVIDSLLIELGLDATKFDAAQKKSVDALRQFDEQNTKTAKQAQVQNNATAEGYNKAKNALLSFSAAALGANGVKEFIAQQVTGNAALGRTSQMLGMGVKDLDAWGAAMGAVGGTAGDFQASMQAIMGGLQQFRMGMGGEGIVTALARLNVQAKNGTVDMLELSDALVKVRNAQGIQAAAALSQQLGITPATLQLLLRGREAVSGMTAEMQKLSGVSDKNTEAATRLEGAWAKFKQTISGMAGDFFGSIAPDLENTLNAITNLFNKDREKRQDAEVKANAAAKNDPIAQAWLKLTNPEKYAEQHKQSVSGQISGAGGKTGVGGSTDIIDFFKSKGWTEAQATGIAANIQRESGGKENAVGDQGKAYGLGQWHPDRQAEFAKQFGKPINKSSKKEQLEFYDWELRNTEKKAGDALSGAKSSEVAAAIISALFERPANAQGEMVSRAQIAKGMTNARNADQKQGGTSQVQTTIGTINVNTKATDANGIAKDMHKALQDNALINYGTGVG